VTALLLYTYQILLITCITHVLGWKHWQCSLISRRSRLGRRWRYRQQFPWHPTSLQGSR